MVLEFGELQVTFDLLAKCFDNKRIGLDSESKTEMEQICPLTQRI